MKDKTALVLGGGGSRGAYEIGVWQALLELGIDIDIVTGTSVGALNGAMVVMEEFDQALSLWQNLETEKIFSVHLNESDLKLSQTPAHPVWQIPVSDKIPPRVTAPIRIATGLSSLHRKTFGAYAKAFFENGGADYSGLKHLMEQYLDEEKLRNSPMDFGIVTVEKESLKPRFLYKEDIPSGQVIDYLLASSACFPAMKSYTIDDVEYIDGAYSDNIPVEMAVQKGAKRIIAVDLEAPGIIRKIPLDPSIQFHIIQCPWDLGDFLVFDGKNSKRLIRLGYLDTMKYYDAFDGHDYTFIKGSLDLRTLRSAESAGRLYSVDPCLIYGQETFRDALIAQISKEDIKAHFEIRNALDVMKSNPLRSIVTIFKESSPGSMALVMASIQSQATKELSLLLRKHIRTLFHDRILAANYLVRSGIYEELLGET